MYQICQGRTSSIELNSFPPLSGSKENLSAKSNSSSNSVISGISALDLNSLSIDDCVHLPVINNAKELDRKTVKAAKISPPKILKPKRRLLSQTALNKLKKNDIKKNSEKKTNLVFGSAIKNAGKIALENFLIWVNSLLLL